VIRRNVQKWLNEDDFEDLRAEFEEKYQQKLNCPLFIIDILVQPNSDLIP